MTPEAILHEVRDRGVDILAVGDRLRLYPRSKLTEELLAELLKHKPELLRLLTPERGKSLTHHPWIGRQVTCPKGRGRLGWTDGFRAGVSTEPNVLRLVALADVRLVEAT